MRSVDVHRALVTALVGALAAAPLGGCGSDVDSVGGSGGGGTGGTGATGTTGGSGGGIVDPELEAPFTCEEGSEPFEALRVDLGLDSIERREIPEGGEAIAQVLVGTHCATATDVAACEDAVAAATSEESLFDICGGCAPAVQLLVSTSGDEVATVSNLPAMLTWTGTIDTPAKAWLVAEQASYRAKCGEAWIREDGEDHLLLTSLMIADCPTQYADVLLRVRPDGSHEEVERVVLPETGGCAGRRPEGLAPRRGRACETAEARHLAQLAHLEAASVDAFGILEAELEAHGAPAELRRRLRDAAADEVRHAARMGAAAVARGADVAPPTVARGPVRSLLDLALENAAEGCVRETWGALEAMWQSRRAAQPELRALFAEIARDEARHAQLSWDLASWLDARLGDDERARVAEARRAAAAALERELAGRPPSAALDRLGVPRAAEARELFGRVQAALA